MEVVGLVCFTLYSCVQLNQSVSILIVEDTTPYCLREVRGCALLNESRVIVKNDTNKKRQRATLFHELLHIELGPDHTKDFLKRDNDHRDYIGVIDRMELIE